MKEAGRDINVTQYMQNSGDCSDSPTIYWLKYMLISKAEERNGQIHDWSNSVDNKAAYLSSVSTLWLMNSLRGDECLSPLNIFILHIWTWNRRRLCHGLYYSSLYWLSRCIYSFRLLLEGSFLHLTPWNLFLELSLTYMTTYSKSNILNHLVIYKSMERDDIWRNSSRGKNLQ